MKDKIELIANAAEKVDATYLKLKTTYSDDGIVRERVFCYELYHQLRLLHTSKEKLIINGEIDKRGHPDFKNGGEKNPDFVFHIPGGNESNTIILEVKGTIGSDIPKDLETISHFILKQSYQIGILLVYNHNLKDLITKHKNSLNKIYERGIGHKVYIITLPEAHNIENIVQINEIKDEIN